LILFVKFILQEVVGYGKNAIKIKLRAVLVIECVLSSWSCSFLVFKMEAFPES